MINLEKREGYLNRHLDGLPEEICKVEIIYNEMIMPKPNGDSLADIFSKFFLAKKEFIERAVIGIWTPFEKMPNETECGVGFLGDFKSDGEYLTAWKDSNSEFVYYKIIENSKPIA